MRQRIEKGILIPVASLWLLLAGMHGAVYTALGGEIPYRDTFWLCGVLALLLLFFAWLPRWKLLAGIGIVVIGTALYVWKAWAQVNADLEILANCINQCNLTYANRTLFPQSWCRDGTLEHNSVVLAGCIIAGFYIAVMGFRLYSKFYSMLPIVLLYCAGLLIGAIPNRMSALLLMLGMALTLLWVTEWQSTGVRFPVKRRKLDSTLRPLLCLMVLAAGITGAWALTGHTSAWVFRNVKQVQHRQGEMELCLKRATENTIQYARSILGTDGQGQLSNASPRYRNKKVMEVTVEQRPSESIYLHGYTGDVYHAGNWGVSKILSEDSSVNVIRRHGQGTWTGTYQESLYTSFIGAERSMSIRYTSFGKRSRYLYLPYSEETGKTVSVKEREHYQGEDDDRLELYEQFAADWGVSSSFADEAFVEDVQDMLWNNAEYSQNLETLPFGQDYAEYFLFVSKKGYCEHFATAGTLLMRHAGLCARYVSGYRIEPERFVRNEDGSYTAEVRDSDAHAWAELLVNNRYWMPQEMTPVGGSASSNRTRSDENSSSSAENTPTAAAGISEHPEERQAEPTDAAVAERQTAQSPAADSGKTGAATTETQEPESGLVDGTTTGADGIQVAKPGVWTFVWIGLGILCIFGLGLTLWLRHRRIRQTHRMKWMRRKSPNRYVSVRLGLMLRRLRLAGLAVHDRMPEQQWAAVIADALGSAGDDAAERLIQTARRARYSDETISQVEVWQVDSDCHTLENLVKNRKK